MADVKDVTTNIGHMRAKTELEIKQDKDGLGREWSDGGEGAKDAHKQAVKMMRAQQTETTERFGVSDLTLPAIGDETAEKKVKVKLLYDYWDGQGIRHPLGADIDLPVNEAMRLLTERKAERRDPLTTIDEYEKL